MNIIIMIYNQTLPRKGRSSLDINNDLGNVTVGVETRSSDRQESVGADSLLMREPLGGGNSALTRLGGRSNSVSSYRGRCAMSRAKA